MKPEWIIVGLPLGVLVGIVLFMFYLVMEADEAGEPGLFGVSEGTDESTNRDWRAA